jgi:oligoribonuclease (3'-5' exoribonuclease)
MAHGAGHMMHSRDQVTGDMEEITREVHDARHMVQRIRSRHVTQRSHMVQKDD